MVNLMSEVSRIYSIIYKPITFKVQRFHKWPKLNKFSTSVKCCFVEILLNYSAISLKYMNLYKKSYTAFHSNRDGHASTKA